MIDCSKLIRWPLKGLAVAGSAVALAIGASAGPLARPLAGAAAQIQPMAGNPELLLDQGRRLFESFQYDQAVPQFDRIIAMLSATAPGAQVQRPDLLVAALELRARARFALGDAPGAEQDFSALLQVNPSFRLGTGISPRVIAVLESVRKLLIGQVAMSLTPAGDVQLDGRTVSLRPEATVIDLPAGEHQVAASRQGYRAVTERFTVVAGASAPLAIALERVSATLAVMSIPEGAEVIVDGTLRGTTAAGPSSTGPSAALVVADLSTGSHTLRLRRACFQDEERTINVATPDDLKTEPIRLSPAVATVRVQANEGGASVFLDGVSQGTAPASINNLCAGSHVIEVRGPRGRFVDRREWKTGETATLTATLRSAFPIVMTPGVTGPAAAELRANVERALAATPRLLVFSPSDAEIDGALRGETVPPNWLIPPPSGAPASARPPREIVRELGRRLATKLAAQGVAAVAVGSDPYQVTLSFLAAGSGEPDIVTLNLSDPASRTRAIERMGAPLPSIMRASIQTSVVDLTGTPGAVVVRATGSGAAAGLAVGDVIVGAGGSPIASVADLRAKLATLRPPSMDVPFDVKGPAGAARAITGAVVMVPDVLPLRDPALTYNRALTEMEDAVRLAATPADRNATRLNLAVVQMRLGNWEGAETELRSVQLPDGAGVSSGTVAYLTGLCLEALGRTADARAAFTRAAAATQARLSYDGPLVAPLAQLKLAR